MSGKERSMAQNRFTKELYNYKVYGNAGNEDVLNQVPASAVTILDVGCGAGDNAAILKRLNKYVTGITISNEEALLAKSVCDEVIIANIEEDGLQLTKRYDVVILSHVCEHLVHPCEAINKLAGHLNETGIMIIAVPNMAFYKSRFKVMKGDWTMSESGPFDKTHLHFFSYHSADALCDGKNLKVIKKIPGELAIPLWPLRKVFPAFCEKMDNYIGKKFPNLFSQQVILLLEMIK